jgi:hypothetical protein
MKKDRFCFVAAAICFAATTITEARALPYLDNGLTEVASLAPTKVLVLGKDGRVDADRFATAQKIEVDKLKQSHAASGLIQCGRAHGAGQLTLANDVITTAAHVFFDEHGMARARTCYFVTEAGSRQRRIPIDMGSIVAGAARPYAVKAVNDWAVARLVQPIEDVVPYELADDVTVDQAVRFVSRGHSDWGDPRRMSFEACRLRALTNQAKSGSREFAFDCATADGASGGAVLLGSDQPRLGAILVGWRSNDPSRISPYSPTNYNFCVSVEGAFRNALLYAANRGGAPGGAPQTASRTPDRGANGRETRRSARPN